MLCFTFEFHAYARECQVGSVPGAALPLTVATLAVVRRNRFGGDIITDRPAGASAGISLAHDFSPTNSAVGPGISRGSNVLVHPASICGCCCTNFDAIRSS